MALRIEYSEQMIGGIGYRMDINGDSEGRQISHSYTTNTDGSGLFFHNGHGDRRQEAGTGQFHARSMRQFRARTKRILDGYREWAEVEE